MIKKVKKACGYFLYVFFMWMAASLPASLQMANIKQAEGAGSKTYV